jgi:hypothetical protein
LCLYPEGVMYQSPGLRGFASYPGLADKKTSPHVVGVVP